MVVVAVAVAVAVVVGEDSLTATWFVKPGDLVTKCVLRGLEL